jgi:hypothetical protein
LENGRPKLVKNLENQNTEKLKISKIWREKYKEICHLKVRENFFNFLYENKFYFYKIYLFYFFQNFDILEIFIFRDFEFFKIFHQVLNLNVKNFKLAKQKSPSL